MAKSHADKVVARVGKRPQTATQIGRKLGYNDHRGVARTLSEEAKKGRIVRLSDGKYQSA